MAEYIYFPIVFVLGFDRLKSQIKKERRTRIEYVFQIVPQPDFVIGRVNYGLFTNKLCLAAFIYRREQRIQY